MDNSYTVYIKVDAANRITEITSSAFISDTAGWVQIDEGVGDKYHHAQGNYLENSFMDILGSYNYKFEENKIILRTEAERQGDIINIPKPVFESERLAALEKAMLAMMGGSTIV